MMRNSLRIGGGGGVVRPGSIEDLCLKKKEKIKAWTRGCGLAPLSSDALLINITIGAIKGPPQVSLMETVQFLIEDGAKINAEINADGDRLIHCLAQEGRAEAIHVLSECGADVCVETKDGGTALLMAAVHNHADVIHVLSQCEGVDVNAPSKSGWTPIQIAANNKDLKAMDALIDCGARFPFVSELLESKDH